MSRTKGKTLANELAEQLVELIEELRTASAMNERERATRQNAAIATADRLTRINMGVRVAEHAERVHRRLKSACAPADNGSRASDARLKRIGEDAADLLGAVNRTREPVSDLERITTDPKELAEKLVEAVQTARSDPRKRTRERLHGRVADALRIILREAKYLDHETRDTAAAVRANFAEANAWHGWNDNGESAAHYLQRAEDHACALRDVIRARPESDEQPGRREP